MINYILFTVVFLLYIDCTGAALNGLLKRTTGRIDDLLTGFLAALACFELTALPFMLTRGNFYALETVSLVCALILFVLSVFYLYKKGRLRQLFHFRFKPDWLWILTLILIVAQTIYPALMSHFEGDDSFYIAVSSSAIYSGKIFAFDPSLGLSAIPFPDKYIFTAYELFNAVCCSVFKLDTAVFNHTYLVLLYIPFSYSAMYCLSGKLFGRDKSKARALFLLMFWLITCFCGYTGYFRSTFMIFKPWLGKSVMINIVWPMFLCYFLEAREKAGAFIAIVVALIAGVSCSVVGLYLLPVSFACLVLVRTVTSPNRKYFLKCCLTALPSLLLLLLYLWMMVKSGGLGEVTDISFTRDWMGEFTMYFRNNLLFPILYAVSVIWFLVRGNQSEKLLFVWYPLCLFVTFLNPLLYQVVARYLTGIPVYWRLIWLIPLLITICTAFVQAFFALKKYWKLLMLIPVALIIVFGRWSFSDQYFYPAENEYKISGKAEDAIETIRSHFADEDAAGTAVVFSNSDYNEYIRQAAPDIALAWARDSYVSEGYARIGRTADFETLQKQYDVYTKKDGNDRFDPEVLKEFGINTVIVSEEHPELDGWTSIQLENGDLVYFSS